MLDQLATPILGIIDRLRGWGIDPANKKPSFALQVATGLFSKWTTSAMAAYVLWAATIWQYPEWAWPAGILAVLAFLCLRLAVTFPHGEMWRGDRFLYEMPSIDWIEAHTTKRLTDNVTIRNIWRMTLQGAIACYFNLICAAICWYLADIELAALVFSTVIFNLTKGIIYHGWRKALEGTGKEFVPMGELWFGYSRGISYISALKITAFCLYFYF